MPRKYHKKDLRVTYDPQRLIDAAADVRRGYTLRAAAEKYEVPFGTLCKHYKKTSDVKLGGGRKPELSNSDEQDLAQYLKVCASHGEGLTRKETIQLVTEFVVQEKLETRWKNEKGPGEDWFNGFLARHPELRIRKGEVLSSQRVRGADPFIIKKFYDDIEQMYRSENISREDGGLVFNCDETAFSHDPKDVKIVAEKGVRRISKNIAGSGKTNTTVLACGAADGTKLPSFIIFMGKQMWSTWIPQHEFPGTCYASQENGWMNGNLFVKWFQELFWASIPPKEKRQKKVVLFFDGVIFHISYELVKIARENDVVLVKFPPNVSHFIQPLDKTVFKTMKTDWNQLLLQHNRKFPGRNLAKAEFAEYIGTLWEESFKSRNLRSGFASTGLFPLNFKKFPDMAYDPVKFERYNAVGDDQPPSTPRPTQSPSACTSSNPLHQTTADVMPVDAAINRDAVPGPSHELTEAEMSNVDVAETSIEQISVVPVEEEENTNKSSFELFIRKKLSQTVSEVAKTSTQPGKRRKVSQAAGEILTSNIIVQRLEEEQKSNKAKISVPKRQNPKNTLKQLEERTKKKKPPSFKEDNTTSEYEPDLDPELLESEDEINLSDTLQDEDEENAMKSPVTLEAEKYIAIFYDISWYLGRITSVKEETCTVKFLKQNLDSFKWPPHEDKQEVAKQYIFYGPIKLVGNGPFNLRRADHVKIQSICSTMKKRLLKP